MNTNGLIHNLGKRDCIAEIFMMIKLKGVDETLKKMADELLEHDPDHPHAKWFIKSLTK